jgi:DNA polymerase
MAERMTQADLRDILSFYLEAGVDEALEESPINRLLGEVPPPEAIPAGEPAASRRSLLPEAKPAAPVRIVPAAVPAQGQVMLARELAASAGSLEQLRALMAGFDGCNLKHTAKNLVFADGNPDADLMLVGEAPGRDEDIEGLPFVGRSGQLLDRILAAIGRDRTSAYIANVIPWRPPGNRAPTPQEIEICRPFIERQIELAQPKVLISIGGSSAKTLLSTTEGILKLRGGWKTFVTPGGVSIPLMPTLHPAYLLRTPAHKKFVWRDFLEVKIRLRSL